MKRKILGFLYTFLIIGHIFGQDNFEQSTEFQSYTSSLKRFYNTIAPSLLNNLSKKPLVRFVTDFSMGHGGCVISIDYDSLNKPKLCTHCYSFKRIVFKVISTKIEENSIYIPSDFSDKVVRLFKMAMYQIKYVEKPSIGMDGTTYFFFVTDSNGNSTIAEAWSPEKASKINKIISIIDDLVYVAKGNLAYTKSISEKIDNLLKEQKE
jgi:hypothetical protein